MNNMIYVIFFISSILAVIFTYKMMKTHAKSVRLNKLLNKYYDIDNMQLKEIEQARSELAKLNINVSKDKSVYEREIIVYSTISIIFAIATVALTSVIVLPVFTLEATPSNLFLVIILLLASLKFFEFYKISKINYKLAEK